MSTQLHTCTPASPMRMNSNPDDWTHPDMIVTGEPWYTFGNPDEPVEVECVYAVCPHCEHAEQRRTGNERPRIVMP